MANRLNHQSPSPYTKVCKRNLPRLHGLIVRFPLNKLLYRASVWGGVACARVCVPFPIDICMDLY